LALRSGEEADYIAPVNFDIRQLKSDDHELEALGLPPRIGTVIPVSLTYPDAGRWVELPSGQKVWQLSIEAGNAIALSLYYKEFRIPEGAKLFIYNDDHTHLLGAYTDKTNGYGKNFATELIAGDHIILEYVPASIQTEEPIISISGINYGYNNLSVQYNGEMGHSASCQVDVNCESGWDNQRNSVYKVVFKKGTDVFLCTGAMLNNTKQDLAPISLTAFHCIDGISTEDLNEAVFYFNYQQDLCGRTTADIDTKTIVGATLLTSSLLEGNSDGALIRLNMDIPSDYNVYYNGWDNGWGDKLTPPQSGVGIHHPLGDVKKISVYTKEAVSASWDNDLTQDTHWKIYWSKGLTEGGSSGSPLFDKDGYIVGSLSGAPRNSDPCSNPVNYSLYGKFAYFWNGNPEVKSILDPDNKGLTRLKGTYTTDNKYVDFRVDKDLTEVYAGEFIFFKNESTINGTRWTIKKEDGGILVATGEKDYIFLYVEIPMNVTPFGHFKLTPCSCWSKLCS